MSKNAQQLAQTIEMLELMNDALRHLRTEALPNPPPDVRPHGRGPAGRAAAAANRD